MTPGKHGLRAAPSLSFTGHAVLALVVGMALGLLALGCGSPSPTPEIPTATPTPTLDATQIALQTATSLPGSPTPTTPTPTPSATPCPSPPAGWVPYTVKAGDTLSELAMQTGVDQERILEVNCLTSSELLAGQVLALPPMPTPTPCGTVPAGWVPYTVQPGDTLFGLASRAGVSQEQVMQVNCLTSPQLQVGQDLYLPPLPTPTPTPCLPAPPADWVLYTVRPGDTLFSLAVTRGTTTDEVMRVNCLNSSDIWAGDTLYLPPLPITYEAPAMPSAPSPPLTEAPGCASAFSCSSTDLPSWIVEVGAPGDPLYEPCATEKGFAWISVVTENQPGDNRNDVKHGWRVHYFACEFGDPDTLTASMTGPGGTQPLVVEPVPSYLDPQEGRLQGRVTWNVACNLTTGLYTLTIENDSVESAQLTFTLTTTNVPRILVAPQVGPPGTDFQVYYCGYEAYAEKEIDIDFFYKTGEQPDGKSEFSRATSWTVPINAEGWGRKELRSRSDDPEGVYAVRSRTVIQGADIVWLISD
jgi:LysM repeat protein